MDAEDASNISYGYSMTDSSCTNKIKKSGGSAKPWWLRSADIGRPDDAGRVTDPGVLSLGSVLIGTTGVAPALNIDRSSVIFSSLISGTFNTTGAEYKLTLKDMNLIVTLPAGREVMAAGNEVMVPYEVAGPDAGSATRLSCLITDKKYSESDAKILYYDAMGGTFAVTGSTGTFTLPYDLDMKDWGSGYHVYILAEDINEGKLTDYASEPCEISASKIIPAYTVTVSNDGNVIGTASPVKAVEGTTITLTAYVKNGYQFKEWQVISGDVTLADASDENTTFVLGTQDVVIKAVSEKKQEPPKPTIMPEDKDQSNTCLCTSKIASPARPASADSEWQGSYVYFGNYDGNPVRYRVLAPETTDFRGSTLFLDSDEVLYNDCFDEDNTPNTGATNSNEWAYSDVKNGLNGDKFLDKGGVFTATEKGAIAEGKVGSHPLVASDNEKAGKVASWTQGTYGNYVALTGEKIFLLDGEDASNISYGYSMTSTSCTNKIKKSGGSAAYWWLRSADTVCSLYAGKVNTYGELDYDLYYNYYGVAPALNIDRTSVIFSSLISGSFNATGAEYKLTLKDTDLTVALPAGSEVRSEGNTVMVPYEVAGSDAGSATRLSCLITDKEYYESGAKILYYVAMGGTFAQTGSTGTFTLPSDLDMKDWGSGYHIYILAEDINEGKLTDYASEPYELGVPSKIEHKVTVEADENVMATANPVKGIKGTKVTLNAFLKEGYQFKEWQVVSGGVALADKTKSTTTFTIGTEDVVIKAVSEEKQEPEPTAQPTGNPTTAPAEPTNAPAAVKLTLDKATAQIKCGGSDSLKATLSGSTGKISWKSSDTKIAAVDANGKITTKQAGTVTITASASGKSAVCVVTVLYKDVTNTKDFWYAPTNYLTAANVVKGYDKQTKFKPANDCTRAQMVTFLWRLAGEPAPKSTTTKFKDIMSKDYFYKPVLWAVENGITTGVSKTKFNPKGVCTRAQTVTFLWRMAGKPEPKTTKNPFPDVKKTEYFYKATLWASEMKILAGLPDGTFQPQGKCLRRQMVTFLYKYDKYVNGKG